MIEKDKWKIELIAKNIYSDFFLPNLGLSITYIDNSKLGNYPITVIKYEIKLLSPFPNIKGSTTNWPK